MTTTTKRLLLNTILLLSAVMVSAQTSTKKECEQVYARQVIVAVGECQDEEVLLDAGSFTNALFSWDLDNDGVYEIEDQSVGYTTTSFNVAGTYPVEVKIVKSGCRDHFITEDLQIKASKKPSFKIEGTCNEISLQRFGSANDSSIWKLSNGVTLKGDTVDYAFPEVSGKFEVELTSFIGDCSSSSQKLYEFARVSATPEVSYSSQCAPAKIEMSNESAPGTKYSWIVDGVAYSSMPVFSMDFTNEAAHSLELEVSNEFGCKDRTEEPIQLEIAAPLVSDIMVLDSVVCEGTAIEVEDHSTGYTHRTVQWGDGSTETTLKELTHVYGSKGAYSLTTILENRFKGCADTVVYDNALYVAEQPKADFDLALDGTCVPQVLEVQNLSTGNYQNATLLLNAYDTIDFENLAVLNQPGRQEVRLVVENTLGGCSDEHIVDFTLRKPFDERVAPFVLEASQDSQAFEFSWKGLPNTEYFEVYRTTNGEEALLATTTDTIHRVLTDFADTTYAVYSVRAVDQCAAHSALSVATRGINLEGSYQTDSFPTLQWNAFNAWGEELDGYEIERNTGSGWESIGNSFQPHFIDRTYDNNGSEKATYRVTAVNSTQEVRSVSTEWTFEFAPNIFIPSAFSPNYDNLNDVYEIKGYGMERLDVKIFNSFGQRVFDSKGENVHWDGTYKGEIVDEGAYIAVVQMVTPTGASYEFQRSVTVIR